MAAGIAHEIRNPLSGLNFCLSAAESMCAQAEGLEPETREKLVRSLGSSRAAAEKIGEVVRRVMAFARPGPPSMKPVNVNEAVREAVGIASPTLRKNGIRLETALSEDLPVCRADLRLLEQPGRNLVNNAAQATGTRPEGERRIEIASRREGAGVLLTVEDSGEGIPETIREKIFEPFFTTRPDGTGLGLSISRRIVSEHGGSIEIGGSRLGGAGVRVLFPAAADGDHMVKG